MIWIGGTQGSGKSTIARSLAMAFDLPWHPIDLFTYVHAARLGNGSSLEEQLASGTEHAANAFEDHSEARLALVLQDVADRRLGQTPAIVEGPQLLPRLDTGLPHGYAVWLVTTESRTLRVHTERRPHAPDESGIRHLNALASRDAALTARVRRDAEREGRPVIEVPEDPDWASIRSQVETALQEALASANRLEPGRPLKQQRHYENFLACRQGRLWQRAINLVELPPYPFACECGTSGCSETWSGTPDEYDQAHASDAIRSADHTAVT